MDNAIVPEQATPVFMLTHCHRKSGPMDRRLQQARIPLFRQWLHYDVGNEL